jgi:hypothetical protein
MQSRKLAIVIVGSLVFLFGVAFAAWAGGAGGALACCVVKHHDGAIALNGTAAVVYSGFPYSTEAPYIDVKLRLENKNNIAFFQLHLDENIYGLDNYECACLILNPNEPKPAGSPGEPSVAAVATLVDEILNAFFPGGGLDHTNTWLVITRKSITETDGSAGGEIGTTGRIAAMGDVKVYVMNPAKAKLEYNPNCPPPR